MPHRPSVGGLVTEQTLSGASKVAQASWGRVSASVLPYLQSGPVWGKKDINEIPSTTTIAMEMLNKISMDRVVELGCGSGKGLSALAEHGARYLVGIDVNSRATAYARSQWRHEQKAAFVTGNANELPFEENSFSLAVAQAFLTVIPTEAERTRVFRQVREILRPGGHFYIGDFLRRPVANRYIDRYKMGEELTRHPGTFPVQAHDGTIAYLAHHFTEEELVTILNIHEFDLVSHEMLETKTYSGQEIMGISIVAQLRDLTL